jgi:ABC-type spermidine/putrescine transport system permease subunit I
MPNLQLALLGALVAASVLVPFGFALLVLLQLPVLPAGLSGTAATGFVSVVAGHHAVLWSTFWVALCATAAVATLVVYVVPAIAARFDRRWLWIGVYLFTIPFLASWPLRVFAVRALLTELIQVCEATAVFLDRGSGDCRWLLFSSPAVTFGLAINFAPLAFLPAIVACLAISRTEIHAIRDLGVSRGVALDEVFHRRMGPAVLAGIGTMLTATWYASLEHEFIGRGQSLGLEVQGLVTQTRYADALLFAFAPAVLVTILLIVGGLALWQRELRRS